MNKVFILCIVYINLCCGTNDGSIKDNDVGCEEDDKSNIMKYMKENNENHQNNLHTEEYHVLFTFVNAVKNEKFQNNLRRAVGSLLEHTSTSIKVHVVCDLPSRPVAEKIMAELISDQHFHQFFFIDFESTVQKLQSKIENLQKYFSSSPKSYFTNALFFLSIFTHTILPLSIQKVILLDTDIKFKTDVKLLFNIFEEFEDGHVIGLARENQPVYRHLLSTYRHKHPTTTIGDPPPHGKSGFNSGVILMDLERMRNSKEYNQLTNVEYFSSLAKEFEFKGHLGDQDFYTLLSFQHHHLFHTLPCQWNRQLCRWWYGHGYENVFEEYFNCQEPIHLYHGNCDTPIP